MQYEEHTNNKDNGQKSIRNAFVRSHFKRNVDKIGKVLGAQVCNICCWDAARKLDRWSEEPFVFLQHCLLNCLRLLCAFFFWNVCVSEQSDIRSLWIRSFLGINHQFMSICFGFIFCDLIFVIFFPPHILITEKNLGEQIMRKKIKILYARSEQTLCGVIQIKMSRNCFLLKS